MLLSHFFRMSVHQSFAFVYGKRNLGLTGMYIGFDLAVLFKLA